MSDHWSVSAINQYLSCSLQYSLQRIEGIPPQHVTSQSILGRSVHNALSIASIRRKQGKRMPRKDLADAFAEELKAEVKLSDTPIEYKDGEDLDTVLSQGKALVECWADHAPAEEVVSAEDARKTAGKRHEDLRHEKARANGIHKIEQKQAQGKISTLTLLSVSFVLALVIVVLLLARERWLKAGGECGLALDSWKGGCECTVAESFWAWRTSFWPVCLGFGGSDAPQQRAPTPNLWIWRLGRWR